MGIRSRSRTGDLTHLCSIGAGDLFPRKLRLTFGVDLIAACGQEQKKHSGVLSLQDDQFRDLIHVAVDRLCGFLCGPGYVCFHHFCIDPGYVQSGRYAFQTFAHPMPSDGSRQSIGNHSASSWECE